MDLFLHSLVKLLSIRLPKTDWSDVAQVLSGQRAEVLGQLLTDAGTATSARQFRATLEQRVGGNRQEEI